MTSNDRPHIIWIQSDQHNPAVIGAYGDSVVETPNLDKLASKGTLLRNAYCPSPICVPSRMSLITGMYPYQTEVWTNDQILNSAIPTYAHSLGAVGYEPIQIGRMHFNGVDQKHGFAKRLVGDHGPNYPGSPDTVDHGILSGTTGPARVSLQKSGRGQNAYEVHDEEVEAATISYIDNIGKKIRSGSTTNPISLSVGLMLPHQPFVARQADYDKYVGKVGMPKVPEEPIENCHPYIRWWRERTGIVSVTEEEIIRSRTAYWALCERTDALVGSILKALESNGILENAIVIYTSDHGEQAGEHGLWWKQTFYEDSVKVPAIISWPGHIQENVTRDIVLNQFDLISTILEASGAPDLPRSNGRSLLSTLQHPNENWENIAFSEYCMSDSEHGRAYSPNLGGDDIHAKPGGVQNRMIRSGPWKLNYYHGYQPQLFNLQDDPAERLDRNNDPSCKGIKSELLDRVLENWDPDLIRTKMHTLKEEQIISEDWASNTAPKDELRWELDPNMDQLTES